MLPAFTPQGKIIMEAEGKVAMAPDGNGGLYVALDKHGIFKDMETHGVEALDCCSVDNILVRVGDPVFAGYCVSNDIQCGARVVAKSYPEEKVGVFAQRGGKLQVVEYSELDPVEASSVDEDTGVLKYNWSNICLHYFEREWLKRVSNDLMAGGQYHVAKKKIPSLVSGFGVDRSAPVRRLNTLTHSLVCSPGWQGGRHQARTFYLRHVFLGRALGSDGGQPQ